MKLSRGFFAVVYAWLSLVVMCVAGPASAQPPSPAPSSAPSSTTTPTTSTPASLAISTMFSPLDVPQRKTMGLLQRNFLEMAGGDEGELEVALVIDGTNSMSAELAGVRGSIDRMLEDLRRFRKGQVRASIVVYRDYGSPSGEVSIVLPTFTADKATIDKAVESLQPESGEPFFHELPDVGLHTAITQLPWSDSPDVVKWVMLFADAPPYSVTFRDAKFPGAHRRFTNELLVSLARKRGIQINCILCTSSDDNVQPYQQVVDQTREFMSELASQSSGVMLDLSYPAIQTALIEAGKRPEIQYAKLAPINEFDLAAARRADSPVAATDDGSAAAPTNVSIAVVPHEPIEGIRFDPDRSSVQVATAIRHRFARLPGVRVVSTVDIQRQLRRLRAEGMTETQAIRGLAGRLRADYVVWGSVVPQTQQVQTAAYRRRDGEAVIQVAFDGDYGQVANVILTAASKDPSRDPVLTRLANLAIGSASKAMLQSPIAETAATSSELLAALESLEQSLAFAGDSDESIQLLKTAEASARAAVEAEPRNPLGHWLLSNVAFNQAMRDYQRGALDEAKARMAQMKSSLRRAYRDRAAIQATSLVEEIAGDHALLVDRNVEDAISHYKQLIDLAMPSASQLRGHWMLAGIYAGDWGVPDAFADLDQSRRHVIEILANWPDSPEGQQLKQWLRWDDASGRTEHDYLPTIHVQMSKWDEV
ncbi:hypothetical protein Rcae01_03542 [Novipirellula caenicola]|uniref:VWFA domain-containing protein n=2 Tax=Novipirellula caenicola TaxID=1536901 RepID=A0ABP9VSE1_9BACT